MSPQHVIIGAGDTGTALSHALPHAHLRDIEPTGPATAHTLHICVPYGLDFTDQIRSYQIAYRARLVIVHSTVPVGTCDPHHWVHSPWHTEHDTDPPTKFFGGPHAEQATPAFTEAGITARTTPRAATTEAAQLWHLTQHGLHLAVQQVIHTYCTDHGLDYDLVRAAMTPTHDHTPTEPDPVGAPYLAGATLLGHELGDLVADYAQGSP